MKSSALAIVREAERESVLIERVVIPIEERSNALEYRTAAEYVPPVWIGPHVGWRLVGAFKTLARMPIGRSGPSGHSGFWPAYEHEWGDLLAQRQAEASDLELQQHLSNRSRVLPSSREVSQMEQVIGWPARYLRARPIIMRVVQRVAAYRSRDLDNEAIARRMDMTAHQLRRRNQDGLDVIAMGLRRDRVAVF